jgi:hypothetical protein
VHAHAQEDEPVVEADDASNVDEASLRYAPTVRAILFAALILSWAASVGAQEYPSPLGYPVPNVSGVPASPRKVMLMRALDEHLERLAEQGGGRTLDGSLELVVGAAFVGISFAMDDNVFRSVLLLTGGISLGRGVNTLALSPDAEQPFMQFRGMAMVTSADIEARLRFGDAALAHLAQRTRAARLVEGTLTMVGSAAYVPLYWGLSRADDPHYRFGDDGIDYVGLALSAVGFASGLFTVIVTSNAERRNDSYRALKRQVFAASLRPSIGAGQARLTFALQY